MRRTLLVFLAAGAGAGAVFAVAAAMPAGAATADGTGSRPHTLVSGAPGTHISAAIGPCLHTGTLTQSVS